MARYRKFEVQTWTDDRFQSLTPAPPNGQTLWLYLLCGPRTTTFPGLVVAREEVIASDLSWSVEGFRKAFQEVFAKGLAKADWKGGVVVLRKALFDSLGEPRDTSRPANPNVLKSWSRTWEMVPECSLKDEYLHTLKAFAKALGKAFEKAFEEGFGKAFAKACAQPSAKQDQESGDRRQDTEEQDSERPSDVSGGLFDVLADKVDVATGDLGRARAKPVRVRRSRPAVIPAEHRDVAMRVLGRLGSHNGVRYSGAEDHLKLVSKHLSNGVTEADLRAIVVYCAEKLDWKNKPAQFEYLRPETLFGPQTITRYLDPARSHYASEIAELNKKSDEPAPLQLVPEAG